MRLPLWGCQYEAWGGLSLMLGRVISHAWEVFSLTERTEFTEHLGARFELTERLRHTEFTERYS